MELDLSDVSLRPTLESGLTMNAERASRAGVALGLTLDPDEITVRADERKLRQVVFNLLSNAVKFTPPDGRVDVSAPLTNGVVEVAVADTGPGIAPEDQELIFEEFRQARANPATGRTGPGWGCRSRGGSSSSTEGVCGSRAFPAQAAPSASRCPSRQRMSAMTDALVLIVDDNEKNMKLARDVLRLGGFRTLEAATGGESISLALEHLPDVILMDIRLPDMDGTEAARSSKRTRGRRDPDRRPHVARDERRSRVASRRRLRRLPREADQRPRVPRTGPELLQPGERSLSRNACNRFWGIR